MKILFVTNNLPYPPILGERLRNYNLLKRIGEQHEIYLLATSSDEGEEKYIADVEKFCVRADIVKLNKSSALDRPLEWFQYLFAKTPPDLRFYYSKELAEKIRKWMSEIDFDIVNIDNSYMGVYWDVVNRYSNALKFLTFHDVLWVNYQRIYPMQKKLLRKIRLWLHAFMLERWEPKIAGKFDQIITVSEDEKQLLLIVNPDLRIDVIFNGVDTKLLQPLPDNVESSAIVFVGDMNYLPNVDAMIYFVKEIYPLIRQEIPQVEMWIVGTSPTQEVLDLQGNGVIVTGRVEDIKPYYEMSKLCVVPLRAGSGTRLKIVEAMALSRAVISTTIGAEGIDVRDGVHISIADKPEDFAAKTIALMKDDHTRKEIAENGRAFVEAHYEWDAIVEKMNSILQYYQDENFGRKSEQS